MRNQRLCILSLIVFGCVTSSFVRAGALNYSSLEKIAIQNQGRVKPFDTYARETVQYLTGRTSWKGMSATEVIFGLLSNFESKWNGEPFILVDYQPLKERLRLNKTQKYFSPKELQQLSELPGLVRQLAEKQRKKIKFSEEEKKIIQLQNQLTLLDGVIKGDDLMLFPDPSAEEKSWFPLHALLESQKVILPYDEATKQRLEAHFREFLNALVHEDSEAFNRAAPELGKFLRTLSAHYPSERSLNLEWHYNHLRPFRWAWLIYTLAFAILCAALVTHRKGLRVAGLSVLLAGFALHSYGFFLRMVVSGRPPVTNMFESVIWVSWGCLLFSIVIWLQYRKLIIPTSATVFSLLCLVLADNLPFVLDPSIHPLEPVLRSNFWLTIHVLTITLSYAAFALSLCLGNVVLGNYLFRPTAQTRSQELTLYMYRAMQIGVVLLAAGTILGGVWADYSWGRFWGWDPKEVWALIALLLYLAVLHGRFTGWLRGFGFVSSTVLSFLGVLMAWYGVNFVLGVGLHSYGFGSGGLMYVLVYTTLQLVFMAASYVRYKKFGLDKAPLFPKQ